MEKYIGWIVEVGYSHEHVGGYGTLVAVYGDKCDVNLGVCVVTVCKNEVLGIIC